MPTTYEETKNKQRTHVTREERQTRTHRPNFETAAHGSPHPFDPGARRLWCRIQPWLLPRQKATAAFRSTLTQAPPWWVWTVMNHDHKANKLNLRDLNEPAGRPQPPPRLHPLYSRRRGGADERRPHRPSTGAKKDRPSAPVRLLLRTLLVLLPTLVAPSSSLPVPRPRTRSKSPSLSCTKPGEERPDAGRRKHR